MANRGSRAACVCALLLAAGAPASPAQAQGVRDRTRPTTTRDETTVSESQGVELTLTVVETAPRALQTWVRTAGTLDEGRRTLVAYLAPTEAQLIELDQRVRVFPPESKSSMTQAKISRIVPEGPRTRVEAILPVAPSYDAVRYVMEIIVERGTFLGVSNEAIIEEGDRQVVYVQQGEGRYTPREIRTGLKGELYAEVLDGLEPGERVVTFGSFFIDAEHKLKQPSGALMDDAHLDH